MRQGRGFLGSLAAITAPALLLAGAAVGLTAPASAAPAVETCVLHIGIPLRIGIQDAQYHVNVGVEPTASCPYTYDVTAAVDGTRSPAFLHFTNHSGADSFAFETGFDQPGVYTTSIVASRSSAKDADGNSVPIVYTSDTTTIKFNTQPYIATDRQGSAVYVNALVKQYSSSAAWVRSAGRTVYLQRYLNGGWQNMLSRTTGSDGKIVVGFVQPAYYQYRVYVTPGTDRPELAWEAYSASSGG